MVLGGDHATIEGPFDWATLESWWGSGAVPGDTFVSHNGGEWVEVQSANPEQQRFDPLAPTWMVLAADNETVEGPFDWETLNSWWASGVVSGRMYVSNNGGAWVKLENANPNPAAEDATESFDPYAPTWMVLAADNESVEGPFDWITLEFWWSSGAVPGDTFVSNNGGEWVEVQNANAANPINSEAQRRRSVEEGEEGERGAPEEASEAWGVAGEASADEGGGEEGEGEEGEEGEESHVVGGFEVDPTDASKTLHVMWQQHIDEDTQVPYYFSPDIELVCWEAPTQTGWTSHTDESTGHLYFSSQEASEEGVEGNSIVSWTFPEPALTAAIRDAAAPAGVVVGSGEVARRGRSPSKWKLLQKRIEQFSELDEDGSGAVEQDAFIEWLVADTGGAYIDPVTVDLAFAQVFPDGGVLTMSVIV
jgi:hypothetical protein